MVIGRVGLQIHMYVTTKPTSQVVVCLGFGGLLLNDPCRDLHTSHAGVGQSGFPLWEGLWFTELICRSLKWSIVFLPQTSEL